MAKPNAKTAVTDLTVLDPNQLQEVAGLKEKQKAIVKANPFVKVTDNKSYEAAKKAAQNLLTASTTVEGQDKTIASFLAGFRKKVGVILTECATMTRTPYDKQKAEIKVWEDEKERKAEEERQRQEVLDNQTKKDIEDLEKNLMEVVETMTHENIELVEQSVKTLLEEKSGSFGKFEILFEYAEERINEAVDAKKESVREAFDKAEENRKKKHTDYLKDIEIDVKELIYDSTYENRQKTGEAIIDVFPVKYDFEEFTDQYKSLKQTLETLWADKRKKHEDAEAKRIEDEKRDKKLQELQEESNYNKRSAILLSMGMDETPAGDFVVYGITYDKKLISTDDDEAFEAQLTRIEAEIGRNNTPAVEEVAKEEIATETVEEAPVEEAEAEEVPMSNFEAAIAGAVSNNLPNIIDTFLLDEVNEIPISELTAWCEEMESRQATKISTTITPERVILTAIKD